MVRSSRSLWGATAGAVSFIVVFLVNDRIKPGYDPVRDYVSEAAIGPGGWVQIVSFLVTGTLLALSAPALARTAGRWTGRLVGLVGAGLIGAGVFVADPAPQDHATWQGIAHNAASFVVFGCLAAACFTAARWQPTRNWRLYCLATGGAVPVLFVASGMFPGATGLLQRITIVLGWSWLAVLGVRAARSRPVT